MVRGRTLHKGGGRTLRKEGGRTLYKGGGTDTLQGRGLTLPPCLIICFALKRVSVPPFPFLLHHLVHAVVFITVRLYRESTIRQCSKHALDIVEALCFGDVSQWIQSLF